MMEPCSSTVKHDPHHYMYESNGYWCEGKPDRPARDRQVSGEPIDPPEVMASHVGRHRCGVGSYAGWWYPDQGHCLPYRLAEALAESEAKVARRVIK